MRRPLLSFFILVAAFSASPLHHALAQDSGDDSSSDDDKKKKDDWGDKHPPIPEVRNAGPCPYVKVLYDAARYVELKDNKETASAVGYTGEIQGLSSVCQYKSDDPIKVQMDILFSLGRGPQASSDHKTYRYWVAVTDRNASVLNKAYFDLPVTFPAGQDRVMFTDSLKNISIPRGSEKISGSNFEVLIGFDVTPEMASFNREGKRFHPNAVASADTSTQSTTK